MEDMNHLRDLLRYDLRNLYDAEEQILAAMPAMIENATNPQLRAALEEHLRITERQRDRLDQVQELLGNTEGDRDGGIFAGLFGSGMKNKGIAGLIDEGQKVMAVDMNPNVMDAAIICCAQKIEHYEICGYGTARAYAEQLGMMDVAQLLQTTLLEEHDADDRLTSLAVSDVNQKAETGTSAGDNASKYSM